MEIWNLNLEFEFVYDLFNRLMISSIDFATKDEG